MDGIFAVTIKRRLVVELHRETDIERGIDELAGRGLRLPDGERLHLGNLARKPVESVDEPLTFGGVAGIFQPDQADVRELPFRRRLGRGGVDREECQRDESDGREKKSRDEMRFRFHKVTHHRATH
jgi:hypothetical protein